MTDTTNVASGPSLEDLKAMGLRDAGLMTIRHPNLVARYGAAMEMLCGRTTSLREFRIDATGFSPEIAEELDDADYLNPLGVNRHYILVHLGQKDLQVLGNGFTTARGLMRSFIEDNRRELFALTSKDAVCGEFEDDTFKVNRVEDLLSIRKIRFYVHTPSGVAEKAAELEGMAGEFVSSETMWLDEDAVQHMCDLAAVAGDVIRTPSVPRATTFEKGNFYSPHLGGVYVFHHADQTTVIHDADSLSVPTQYQGLPVETIHVSDVERVMAFLQSRGFLIELSVDGIAARRETLLRKLEFLVVDHVSEVDPAADLSDIDFDETRHLIYRYHDELPREFHDIARALKYSGHGLQWDISEVSARSLAYMTTARPGADRDLVNHLLCRFTPADYLGLFGNDNTLFSRRFPTWPAARRGYVAEFLRRRLSGRSAALFEAVFGMVDEAPAQAAPKSGAPKTSVPRTPEPARAPQASPWGKPVAGGPWGGRGPGRRSSI